MFYEFHDVSLYRVEEFMLGDNLTQPQDKEGWSEGKGTLNVPLMHLFIIESNHFFNLIMKHLRSP